MSYYAGHSHTHIGAYRYANVLATNGQVLSFSDENGATYSSHSSEVSVFLTKVRLIVTLLDLVSTKS